MVQQHNYHAESWSLVSLPLCLSHQIKNSEYSRSSPAKKAEHPSGRDGTSTSIHGADVETQHLRAFVQFKICVALLIRPSSPQHSSFRCSSNQGLRTFPEALQVLYNLHCVVGVLAANKSQHGKRLSSRSLHRWRFARGTSLLQQASSFLQQPVQRPPLIELALDPSSAKYKKQDNAKSQRSQRGKGLSSRSLYRWRLARGTSFVQ